MTAPTSYLLDHALIDGVVADDVLVEVSSGVITSAAVANSPFVTVDPPPGDTRRIGGLTLPGLANCHSHAFHRALRGHTQRERGSQTRNRERASSATSRAISQGYFDVASGS